MGIATPAMPPTKPTPTKDASKSLRSSFTPENSKAARSSLPAIVAPAVANTSSPSSTSTKNAPTPAKSVKENALPIARIRTIMKSTSDTSLIREDVLVGVSKAAELFISLLARKAHSQRKQNMIEYKDVAEVIQEDDRFEFLKEIVPRKITVQQFRNIIAQKSNTSNDSLSESDSDEEDTSSSSEEE